MLVIVAIDLIVIMSLVQKARTRLEAALPLFCFVLVVMPIESKLVIPGLFDLTTERVAMITMLILFLRRPRGNSRRIPMKRLMYLHMAVALCSTALSISVATSAKQLIGQVIEYYLLYYMLLRTITEIRTVQRILFAIIMGMAVCCVFGLIEAYTRWSVLTIFPSNLWIVYGGPGPLVIEWGRGLRIRSTFPHPILFGDALAMSIPIVLYLLTQHQTQLRRYLLWLALPLMFWSLYKTASRGPWLALAISFLVILVMAQVKMRRYVVGFAILTLFVILVRPGIRDSIFNLYAATQDSASVAGSSYDYRQDLNRAIRSAVLQSVPRALVGYGLGTFREKGLDIYHRNEVRHWYTCDDGWALFLYETGYIGLTVITLMLMKPLLSSFRAYKRLRGPDRYLSGVLFIALGSFYFMLLSVAGYNWGQQGFIAWILISLSVAYPALVIRRQQDKEQQREPTTTMMEETATELAAFASRTSTPHRLYPLSAGILS